MKKISIFIVTLFVVVLVGAYFVLWPKTRLNLVAEAAVTTYPTLAGLTNVVVIDCFTTGTPPVCVGGQLCSVRDAARCALYSDVWGMASGGNTNNILLLKTNIAVAGISNGGQLIAGGSMSTEMDGGVLAGIGGCVGSGCSVGINDKNIFQKYYEIIKYGIASFKDKQ